MAGWGFAFVGGQLVRWHPTEASQHAWHKTPQDLQVLSEHGWCRCGPYLRWLLGRGRHPRVLEHAVAERRRLRAGARVEANAPSGVSKWTWIHLNILWWFSPPLGQGATRFTGREHEPPPERGEEEGPTRVEAARASFRSSLPEEVGEQVVDEARSGYQSSRDRLKSVEARASTFVQVASLASTLVLANSALLTGKHRIATAWILVPLGIAAVSLVAAGTYGLLAVMRTFDQVSPNIPSRVIDRARLSAPQARRELASALLAAQRRTSIIADWKLARLKRASTAFGVTIVFLLVTSGTVAYDALDKSPKKTTAVQTR
jgi:hypothetical protein